MIRVKIAKQPEVLFPSTGYSSRSRMAEGRAGQLLGTRIEPKVPGFVAHGMKPSGVQVITEAGVGISWQSSKLADSLGNVSLDLVNTDCGHADEYCPAFLGKARVDHVGFDDPSKLAETAATEEEALGHNRRVRDEIRGFVENRLPERINP